MNELHADGASRGRQTVRNEERGTTSSATAHDGERKRWQLAGATRVRGRSNWYTREANDGDEYTRARHGCTGMPRYEVRGMGEHTSWEVQRTARTRGHDAREGGDA